MPYPAELLSIPPAIVNVTVVTPAGSTSVEPRPIEQAIEAATQPVKILRNVAPRPENLPANARPGEQFIFAQQPDHLYILCPDNVWRAQPLIQVA